MRGQIQQPRGDHTPATPHLGDVRQVKVVPVGLGVPQQCRFGIGCVLAHADVRVPQDIQALGVRRHEPVFDPVVNHLDEMPGAVGTAVQVAALGRAAGFFSPRGARGSIYRWGERGKDGVEMPGHFALTADHQAVAPLQTPDAAARPHVNIVDPRRLEFPGPANVVAIIRIAAVDEDVIFLEADNEVLQDLIDDAGRNHHPDDTRFLELRDKIVQR